MEAFQRMLSIFLGVFSGAGAEGAQWWLGSPPFSAWPPAGSERAGLRLLALPRQR